MVPLHDDNPTRITPHVTYILIGLNILVFLYEITLSTPQLDQFFQGWAVVPQELTTSFQMGLSASSISEWKTLLTAQFLHGGFLHLGGNMLYLWVFGNNVEEQLGRGKYIFFYLTCGILASLSQWIFDPTSTIPSLGASGAIAGVMGAYILRYPKARIVTLLPLGIFITTIRVPAVLFLGFWFVQQAFYSLMSLGATAEMGTGGIAYWAHAGGFVFGALLGPLLGLLDSNSPRRRF